MGVCGRCSFKLSVSYVPPPFTGTCYPPQNDFKQVGRNFPKSYIPVSLPDMTPTTTQFNSWGNCHFRRLVPFAPSTKRPAGKFEIPPFGHLFRLPSEAVSLRTI